MQHDLVCETKQSVYLHTFLKFSFRLILAGPQTGEQITLLYGIF